MRPEYFDIHSHLDFKDFDADREEVIVELKKNNIFTATVGVDLETSKEAISLADKHENLFATIGLHPGDNPGSTFNEAEFEKLVTHPKVVAIGECGLDYSRIAKMEGQREVARELNEAKRNSSPLATPAAEEKNRQKKEFEKQIEFAVKHGKPLMIHCRSSSASNDAYLDILDMLRSKKQEYGDKLRGNFHFFTSPVEIAKKCLELGFTVSFTGPITFVNQYDDVVSYVPINRMMVETDAPFAAPAPFRGRRSNPLYVREIVKKIAEIKNVDEEKLKQTLVDTSLEFFQIKFI